MRMLAQERECLDIDLMHFERRIRVSSLGRVDMYQGISPHEFSRAAQKHDINEC